MINWLKSIFARPRPSGPPETIRLFRSTDRTLSQDSVTVAQDAWLVEAREGQTIRLFEVQAPQAEQCLITYRAKMKCEGLSGPAFLEMWCRLPGRGEFFSKGVSTRRFRARPTGPPTRSPSYLRKGQRPGLIKLNVVVEGRGKLWLKDVHLLKTPLSS